MERFENIQHELMKHRHVGNDPKHRNNKKGGTPPKRMVSAMLENTKEAVVAYRQVFRQELQINRQLDEFVDRLDRAYRSDPTTPRYDKLQGSEDLPLGEEFQQHLNVFIESKPHP